MVSATDALGACVSAGASVVQASAGVVPAADAEVTIPKELVDSSVFQANWGASYKDNEAVKGLIDSEFATLYFPSNDDGDKYQQVIAEYRSRYEQALSTGAHLSNDEIIHTMLDVALQAPELRPVVPLVWKRMSNPHVITNIFIDSPTAIAESIRRYSVGERLLQLAPHILDQLYDCAQKNPAVATAFDQQNSAKLKSSIRDSAKQVIQQNPDLPLQQEIRDRIGEDGSISISINELTELSQSEFDSINASIDDMEATLVQIDANQDVLVDYVNNQELRQQQQAIAAAKAAEHQLKLEAAQSSITIIHTLAGFVDPKLANDIATIGGSALQIAESMNGWLDAVAGLSTLDKVTSLSTVVMTGNVLGAVMNVVSLFGDKESSADQMILEEIGKLREQVNQLRTEMHERFDRIDSELNTIYSTMQDRFDLVDVQLGKLNGKIDDVQKSLVALDLKLSRIERNNFEFLDALGRRPLLDAISGGLDYQQRTGLPMLDQPEFVNFENVLQSWGAIHAFDALAAGPTERDYSDGQVLAELNAFPIDSNLNYFNGWLTAHGLPALTNTRLASPRDWLFATRAYAQLGAEWPQHMQRIDPQRQAALDAVGADLEAALHNISTRHTAGGVEGNHRLFGTVITNYQNKLAALDSSIQAVEMALINEVRANRLQRNDPFDLYGGTDQALAYQAPELSMMTCGGLAAPLPAPDNLIAFTPNINRYNLAEYLRLGAIKVCLAGALLNSKPACKPGQDACDFVGNLRVSVSVLFENVAIARHSWTSGSVLVKGEETPTDYAVQHWAGLKTGFEANSSRVEPAPAEATQRAELLNTVTGQLGQQLGAYQHELYGRVLNELTNGSLHPLAVEAAGSKALLNSFATLGLAHAVDNDDFLHAMLYGNQQLMDDSQIAATYALSATQPITGANLMVNPRLVIGQAADQRRLAFTGLIDRYLDAITARTHVEASDSIANTRRALDFSLRVAQIEVQSTPSSTPMPTPSTTPAPTESITPTPSSTPITSTDMKQLYLPLIVR